MGAFHPSRSRVRGRGASRSVPSSKYRSGTEGKVAKQLIPHGLEAQYETIKLPYTIPAFNAKYLPDFPIGPKPIFLEVKGSFNFGGNSAKERKKYLLVRDQNPGVDIRFVFADSEKPIYKGSPTSHAKWCDTHGFQWADKGIVPEAWIKEAMNG